MARREELESNIGLRDALKMRNTYDLTRRLISWVMPHRQVGVCQRLLAADPLRRVEAQHLAQEVERHRVCVRVERLERDPGLDGERADVVLCTRGTDPTEGVLGGRAKVVKDLVELVDVAVE
jgi:hypothetical protein